jgi:hypothetical protein
MKKAEYYESTLKDLKKEQGRETQVLKGLNEIHNQLQCQGYQPLDPLENVIQELETRRGEVKGAIKRIEELVK